MSQMYHEVERRILPNGVKIVHVRTNLPIAIITLWFPFGSRKDSKGKDGIAHLMEHLLMKSTPSYPTVAEMRAYHVSKSISYNAYTSAETMCFAYKSLAEDVLSTLSHFVDVLQTMTVSPEHLTREKRIIADERARKLQEPQRMLFEWSREALFPGSGIDHSGLGTAASLEGITHEDVLAFAKENVTDALKTFVICSPYAVDTFALALASLPSVTELRDSVDSTAESESKRVPLRIVRNDAANVHVSISHAICASSELHDTRILRLLMKSYLATGTASRLIIRLREELQLTYAVRAGLIAYSDRGEAWLQYSVAKDRLSESLQVCEEEFNRLRNGIVDERLLTSAKKEMRYKMKNQCMDPELVAEWYGHREMFRTGPETFDESCAEIDLLKAEDLIEVARKYFIADRRSIVLFGDVEEAELLT